MKEETKVRCSDSLHCFCITVFSHEGKIKTFANDSETGKAEYYPDVPEHLECCNCGIKKLSIRIQ